MQIQVNNKLVDMDRTIKIAHEGQTLNDTNIQLLMKNKDLFGEQMLLLQTKMVQDPSQDIKDTITQVETANNITTTPTCTDTTQDSIDKETTWDENCVASQSDFDAIITDVEKNA